MPRHFVKLTHQARRGRGDPDEWTIREFFRAVAALGGILGRSGRKVLHWMLQGAQLARPAAAH